MVEYSHDESGKDIDHEGDYIRDILDSFVVNNANVRVGVVVYHDTVREAIHLTDFKNNVSGLKRRVDSLTRYCDDDRRKRDGHDCRSQLEPSGEADLAKALDHVRQNSFNHSRPGVGKLLVPILHSVHGDGTEIREAARRLKEDCVQIHAMVVKDSDSHINENLIKSMVSTPVQSHYSRFEKFSKLEDSAEHNICH